MFYIRRAHEPDHLDIAHIHFKSWAGAYAELLPASYREDNNQLADKIKMWQQIIIHPQVQVWLAHDEQNHNLGFIGYFRGKEDYEITTLYVLPEHQGKGIGAKLIQDSMQKITGVNSQASFHLWVLETNLPAIHFYKKQGFIASGERHEDWYDNKKIVDIKMLKV